LLKNFSHAAPRWAPIDFLTSEYIKKNYFYFLTSLIHYYNFIFTALCSTIDSTARFDSQ